MMDANWRDYFPDHILARGKDYAINGYVRELKINEDRITAVVQGSLDYKVSIDLRNGIAQRMSCNCPYADGGNRCKHMAAVFYEVETVSREPEEKLKTKVTDLLGKVDSQELISFIDELATNDSAIANLLRARFADNLTVEDMHEIKREANEIFRSHEVKGFINYHEAFSFQVDIEQFLTDKTDAMLACGAYEEAFDISTYVFVKLANTDIDDDGDIQGISSVCYNIWKRIISSCGEPEYIRIKTWFEHNAYEGVLVDYMEEILQEFLETELASEEDLREQLERIDAIIDELGESIHCPMEYSHVGLSVPLVIKRIELMKKLGAGSQEVEKYRHNHRHFSVIREQYMEDAKKANDITQLIKLLKESKELDAADRYKVYKYSSKLVEIYHQINDRLNERNERYEMFVEGTSRNIKQYKEIKKLCAETEWPVYRDGMIVATEDKSLKCEIYAEERMTDPLYKVIFEKPEIPLLDRYGHLLAKDHSAEILQIYEQHVRKIAEYARNRSAYEQLIECLCRMLNYKDGGTLVNRLATGWIEAYPTRKVMIAELKKVL